MEAKLKRLAVLLLDDDDGITEEAYQALLDVLPEPLALELNKLVDAVDGRFYLPSGQDWK
ncbi:hypothetical protein [Nitrospira sp. BLG_2]|uniref:hypothetical protein n=1 Tax=Nitrospira sp. BLG_2 TaxID=3397507 RepID=UPI003B9A66C9